MPRFLTLLLLGAVALAAWLWLGGGFDQIADFAAQQQRAFQNDIAGTLRRLRGGEKDALWLLLAACFAYGFFHAVGPGHGKFLVGGYGVGRPVPMARLSAIALAASLGQAVTAVVLVYVGIWVWGLTRERLIGTAERVMAPLSYAAIGLVGLWLLLRGLRRMMRMPTDPASKDHPDPGSHSACDTCGHSHGPSLTEVDAATSLREALALIAGIALRPCTGALFVLIITWQMQIALTGILGAFAMALGTALVTVSVGVAATGARGGVLRTLTGSPTLLWAVPLLEILAGALVLAVATRLLLRVI